MNTINWLKPAWRNDDCGYCREPLGNGEKVVAHEKVINKKKHYHRFHRPCLEQWFTVKHACPTCSDSMDPDLSTWKERVEKWRVTPSFSPKDTVLRSVLAMAIMTPAIKISIDALFFTEKFVLPQLMYLLGGGGSTMAKMGAQVGILGAIGGSFVGTSAAFLCGASKQRITTIIALGALSAISLEYDAIQRVLSGNASEMIGFGLGVSTTMGAAALVGSLFAAILKP